VVVPEYLYQEDPNVGSRRKLICDMCRRDEVLCRSIVCPSRLYVCSYFLWRERVSLLIRTNSGTLPIGPLIGPISDSPDTGSVPLSTTVEVHGVYSAHFENGFGSLSIFRV